MNLSPIQSGITGLGCYLPSRVLTNVELEKTVDTSDEWIYSRTGIRERRIVASNESTVDLAYNAARRALEDAGLTPADVDLIIVATSSPDFQFPSTAALLQDKLGCLCPAFDVMAGCSGFVYGLIVASQFVSQKTARRVLVVGAEVLSRIVNWQDRNTCVLFGDGAGAAVVEQVPDGLGILGLDWGADGAGGLLLNLALGQGEACYIQQNGREVYRFAVKTLGESTLRATQNAGLNRGQIDLIVPHQANLRIIEEAARRTEVPLEKWFVNIEKYGNTSAASIPIALYEAREQGRLNCGNAVVLSGFGAGLTWASCLLRWAQ